MSDDVDWNAAQERINQAGYDYFEGARRDPTASGATASAILALTEVVRQIGIEMVATAAVTFEMEETAQELADQTVYASTEWAERASVTRHVTDPPIPAEHYCSRDRMVLPGSAERCGCRE